ncbi:Peptidase S8/S53 domain containing protein [Rhypophila sp. PSN 637]
MVFFSKLVLLPLAAGTLVNGQRNRPPPPPPPGSDPQIPPGRPKFGDTTAKPIPYQYVIKVQPGRTQAVASKLRTAGLQVLETYQCADVFEGLTVVSSTNQTKEEVQKVAASTGAQKIWNSIQYIPAAPISQPDRDVYPPVEKLMRRDLDPSGYSFLPFVNADKVHAAGFTGQGVKVGVVDSGIDFEHPAFGAPGSCYGQSGCKVLGGYDYVGDAFPDGPAVEDDYPNDLSGHGTHVAGIIAGNGGGFKGIAPDAQLYIYRVFGYTGGSGGDSILRSLCRAANDDVDIVNLSLGAGHGFTPENDASADVASSLVQKGVVVHYAAMNNGETGPFTINETPIHPDITMVASTDAPIRKFNLGGPGWNHTVLASVNGQDRSFTASFVRMGNETGNSVWSSDWPLKPVSLDLNDNNQGCTPFDPATYPDFPAIILIKQSSNCSYETQVQNAQIKGNFITVFYRNDDKPAVSPPNTLGVVYQISKAAGEAIVQIIQQGGSASVDWTLPDPIVQPDPQGGAPSPFTSWGPTFDLAVTKPDVAAVGGNVLSAARGGGWVEMSGTSMATPMLSGIAALFISAHGGRQVWGNRTAYMIKKRLIASARPMNWRTVRPLPSDPPVRETALAPVPQLGAGLVDAWHVINTTTQLSFDNFALSDLARFKRDWSVDIENTGKTSLTYTFSLQPAGGFNMQSTSNKGYLAPLSEITPKSYVPSVTFPTGTFTVAAGQKKKASFRFTAPTGMDQSLLPIYSGNVVIKASNGQSFVVPYTGAAFDVRQQLRGKMFPNGFPKQVSGPQHQDIAAYHTYNFDLTPSVASYPNVTMHLKYGTSELRWDIFKSGWKESQWVYPPVPGQNNYVGSATYYYDTTKTPVFDPATLNKEAVWDFPIRNHARTHLPKGLGDTLDSLEASRYMWFGKLGNDVGYIAPGKYVMRFAALVPNGDPKKAADWTVWKTPEITVQNYNP